jgi:hypothetical protein
MDTGGAHRIYNPPTRKVMNVSYNFVTCVEDSFPFLNGPEQDEPIWFEPTLESFADETEWNAYSCPPRRRKRQLKFFPHPTQRGEVDLYV